MKERKRVSEEGRSPGKNTLTRSKRTKFKMHRIKTQRQSDRITDQDQIPFWAFAVSWVIWRFSSLCGWAEFSLPLSTQHAVLYIPELLQRQQQLQSSACLLRLSAFPRLSCARVLNLSAQMQSNWKLNLTLQWVPTWDPPRTGSGLHFIFSF